MAVDTKLKYQVAVFGNFAKYDASEENLRVCFESFFKYKMLPNRAQEINQLSGEIDNRISLQSIDTGISLNIFSDRLDILAAPVPGSPASKLSLDDFLRISLPVLREILGVFPAEVNRIGFVVESMIGGVSRDRFDSIRSEFVGAKLNAFAALPSVEWAVRDAVRGRVNGVESNFIYSISRVRAHVGDGRTFRESENHFFVVDINSAPGIEVDFKDFDKIELYVKGALGVYEGISKEFEGRIYG